MNRLRELRNEKNMTQESLGDLIDRTQQYISQLENEEISMDSETLVIFADYFDVSTDYILCRSDYRYELVFDDIDREFVNKYNIRDKVKMCAEMNPVFQNHIMQYVEELCKTFKDYKLIKK